MNLPGPHGILLLDKPLGLSSNAAVQRVRRVLNRVKAGHTGSLDPLATGMLPICLGEATKVAGFLLDGDKEYLFTARFGASTATGDAEGEVLERCAVPPNLEVRLQEQIANFSGPQLQVPPMYSALKQGGEALYKKARRGESVVREARQIQIHSLQLLTMQMAESGPEVDFKVRCSKGTYIRSLAEDMARAIGCLAYLSALRRTAAAPFAQYPMLSLDVLDGWANSGKIEPLALLPPDAALPHLARVEISHPDALALRLGQSIICPPNPGSEQQNVEPESVVRVYALGQFMALGRLEATGRLHPLRNFNHLGAEFA